MYTSPRSSGVTVSVFCMVVLIPVSFLPESDVLFWTWMLNFRKAFLGQKIVNRKKTYLALLSRFEIMLRLFCLVTVDPLFLLFTIASPEQIRYISLKKHFLEIAVDYVVLCVQPNLDCNTSPLSVVVLLGLVFDNLSTHDCGGRSELHSHRAHCPPDPVFTTIKRKVSTGLCDIRTPVN